MYVFESRTSKINKNVKIGILKCLKHNWSTNYTMTSIIRSVIKQKINQLIEIGEKDKSQIYSRIVEDFGIERREVRLIARELRQEWKHKIKVLENEIETK